MPRLFVALFTGIALVFMAIGAYMAYEQHRKMTTYVPLEATVVSSEVQRRESTSGSGSDRRRRVTYAPIVRFHSDTSGEPIAPSLRAAGESSGSQSWANEVVAKYPPGSQATIWHDPHDPREAFLLREWSFMPYLFVLFPMLHFSIGLAVGMLLPWARGKAPPFALRGGGWFELPAGTTTGQKLRAWAIIAAAWWGAGALACGHYFAVAEPPYGTAALVVAPIYFGIGLAPLFMVLYYGRLRGNASDARVFVDRDDARCGEKLTVRVEQMLSPDVLVEELRVGLVCTASTRERRRGKTVYSTQERCAVWETLVTNTTPRRGMPLEAKHTFELPCDEPPTSPDDFKEYPRFAWRAEVRTKLLDSPDYRGSFPIVVAPGTRPPPEDEEHHDEASHAEDDVVAP